VVINRVVKGKSPFEGGRDHLSHLLLNKGLSEGKVLTLITASALALALIGVFLAVSN
jgi:UDP-N-acetylmuramyl pentapeptide phosphotransferase/UDP-N-acetylglucosamine-1-phosphate transferase